MNRTLACFMIAIFVASATPGRAETFQECLRAIADKDLAAKVGYQIELGDLSAALAPQFEELAKLNARVQIAYFALHQAQEIYLIEVHPEVLVTNQDLSSFTNYEWRTEYELEARAFDDVYPILYAEVRALENENNGHPDWPGFRAAFVDDIAPSQAFSDLTRSFLDEQHEIGQRLALCDDLQP